MIDLATFKMHCRIDDDFEDVVLQLYLDAAVQHVKDITDLENDGNNPKTYDICVLLLASHLYHNREAASQSALNKIPFGVSALIQNLRPAEGLI